MNDLELMRLYLLYKAGSVQDGKKNSDLLKAAKATANDLTEDEFAWLNKEIENLQSIRDSQAKGQRDTAGDVIVPSFLVADDIAVLRFVGITKPPGP